MNPNFRALASDWLLRSRLSGVTEEKSGRKAKWKKAQRFILRWDKKTVFTAEKAEVRSIYIKTNHPLIPSLTKEGSWVEELYDRKDSQLKKSERQQKKTQK